MNGIAPLVLVLDDEPSVRRSLARLLGANGYRVRTFASAEEFLSAEPALEPARLVLDVRLPGLDGLGLQQELGERGETLPIVFISGHGDIPMSVKAIKAGAVDFLPKPVHEASLVPAVEEALERSRRALARGEAATRARKLVARLTPREAEVFELVVAGKPNKEIAQQLGIAEKTVKLHRGRVTWKLGFRSVADLVRLAQAAGVVPATRDRQEGVRPQG